MRALVQRVAWAKVEVDGEVVGAIEHGLLVYLGVAGFDTEEDRAYLVRKILGLRIFSNDAGKMDRNIVDVGGSLLVVSQFTLYGSVRRGLRPSFDDAMRAEDAERVCEQFVRDARSRVRVETGRFRAHMKVSSLNDGPVTLWLDSRGNQESA